MKQIRYFDMFAGAGGFRSGLANTGDFFMPVGWCEIDKYAQKAYRALYETDGEYFCEDARAIRTDELPDIDLICAGFPCQPFSVSGRRLGFADTRGTLFHEIVRVAQARRPAYLLLENVPGLLSHENGQTFGTILAAIHELGYSLEWSYAVLRKRNTTARISESRSSEGGCTLSDILIADCPEKYFLSPRAMEHLLSSLYPEDRDRGFTAQKEQAHV